MKMASTDGNVIDTEDARVAQLSLSQEVEAILLPLLEKLKAGNVEPHQTDQLVNLIETNLQHMVKAYGKSSSLSAVYLLLSPVERLVAAMVRQGLSTKDIAAALTISSGTVSIHRKHIRKKLGLDGTVTNLHSYLLSLS